MARTTRFLHVDDEPSFGDLVATFITVSDSDRLGGARFEVSTTADRN